MYESYLCMNFVINKFTVPSFSLKSDSTLFRTPINICYNYAKLKDLKIFFFELFIKESHKNLYAE